MTSKTVTQTIIEELEKYGIEPAVTHGARHDHIKWQIPGHQPRMHVGSATAQKHALTFIRARADIRRMLRADGVPLEAVLEDQKKKIFQKIIAAPVIVEQAPAKIERLEKELEAMVDFVFELRENISTMTNKARQEGRIEGIDMAVQVLKLAFEKSLTSIEELKVNWSASELQERRLAAAIPSVTNGHAKSKNRGGQRFPFDKNHPMLGYLSVNVPKSVVEIAKLVNKTPGAVHQCMNALRQKGLVENVWGQGYRLAQVSSNG